MNKATSADSSTGSIATPPETDNRGNFGLLRKAILALGSPKLTAVFFVLAIFLVLLGTLAQVYQDMWQVIDGYFRTWIAWVELRVLFPPSFFPWAAQTDWDALRVSEIPFPGGAFIGVGLFINLFAAHLSRFRVQVRGVRLLVGLVALAMGIVVTWLVIESGHNRDGLQSQPIIGWSVLWEVLRYGLAVAWLANIGLLVYLWRSDRRKKKVEVVTLAVSCLLLTAVLAWVFGRGESAMLTDSSLRILYQLIQGQIAATALLVGCVLLFQKRAGVTLLHAGVGLLMFGEFFVSQFAVEQQMTLREGESARYSQDIRSVEMTITAPVGEGRNRVIAVPIIDTGSKTKFANGARIENDALPFDVEVVRFFENSVLRGRQPDDTSPVNRGSGRRFIVEPAPQQGGVKGGRLDVASLYCRLVSKESGEDLGTYLLSQFLSMGSFAQKAEVNGASYTLDLRFKRLTKPYQLTLLDVRKDDYVGTSMPRNYSSLVRLEDPSRNVDFETKIWMNNPLRYAGETFYQSGYNVDRSGREASTLQVVRNTGWMIPYVSCMIVATGMFAHFFVLLLRFLRRIQERPTGDESAVADTAPAPTLGGATPSAHLVRRGVLAWLVPIITVGIWLLWMGGKAMPPRYDSDQFQLTQFGELPVMYEGRVKPLDTLARNTLRILSNRETYENAKGDKLPAVRWLLDLIARPDDAEQAPVFRVDSLEVLETFGLERRRGFRYSWNELRGGFREFQKQIGLAQKNSAEERTFYQRKILDLGQRIGRYQTISDAFRPLTSTLLKGNRVVGPGQLPANVDEAVWKRLMQQIPMANQALMARQPPLVVPVGPSEQPWVAYAAAHDSAQVDLYRGKQGPPPILAKMEAIFDSYSEQRADAFNLAVTEYRQLLDQKELPGYDGAMTDFEAYFNHFAPFYHLIPWYVFALLLTVFGWLVAASPRAANVLRSSAFWLVVCAFVIHTLALAARVMISGRPPVTNLYSSAVFIGWGCVLIGLVLEGVFRLGVGNFVSAVSGIGTLIIAHFLAGDGDTIRVLQAVLDTQFWLTTHVLTITLGYSATFFAGLLGAFLVAWHLFRPVVTFLRRHKVATNRNLAAGEHVADAGFVRVERTVGSMMFGTICFAAFLSFVGTVLGGLWADDSWGRFWGWDPKENGALIIVLWDTLVLHLYAARLVGVRGLALLAIGGNIVTAWSWFGVNELGVGLHSYGFTEGAARALLLFWISQLVIIAIGLGPTVFHYLRRRWRPARHAAP